MAILSLFAAFFIINIERFSGIRFDLFSGISRATAPRPPVDFDVFYLVAQMVWRGEIEQAYSFATMGPAQEALAGEKVFMPWTYPPQFNLLVAPLAFLPLGVAYGLFTAGTLIAYLSTLKIFAGKNLTLALLLLFPVVTVTMACGQNGFLTGTLIALTCLGFQKRSVWAGLPLGLMVIKPHLAIAFAVYTLATRRWGAALVAAATVAATALAATILLEPKVWLAFLGGMKEAHLYLERDLYPLYRMVSPYAALRTLGLPTTTAFAVQALIAALSLALVCLAIRRKLPPRQALGVTAVASLLISPYAYDYDLTVYGIGLALLLPDLIRLGHPLERALLYGLTFATGAFGFIQSQLKLPIPLQEMPFSLAGVTFVALLGLIWRLLEQDRLARAQADGGSSPAHSTSHA